MAMSASSSGGGDEPMMEINTTPLIDVMLVLLIMLIITLPPPTHAVKIDLPTDCEPNCPPPPKIKADKNILYIAPNSAISWNDKPLVEPGPDGKPVSRNLTERVLLDTLKRTQVPVDGKPIPELHFKPDPLAPYETVHRILKLTKLAEVTKIGFIDNDKYTNF